MADDRIVLNCEIALRGAMARVLLRRAAQRKRAPVELLAAIIEAVLMEDLVDAVLDDGHDRKEAHS